MFIGEWAEKRGIRDQLVIATKVRPILFRSRKNPFDVLTTTHKFSTRPTTSALRMTSLSRPTTLATISSP
jgi:aryl-alcohol dehydrogenase-like predicted oxidoreductase